MLDMSPRKLPLRRALLLGVALIALLAAAGVSSGLTLSGDTVHSGFGAPTIDGVRGPGEWAAADEIPIFPTGLPGSTLLVMNDGENLYIAASVADPTLTASDSVQIRFDNEHNGTLDDGDDLVTLAGNSVCRDQHYDESTGGWGAFDAVRHGYGSAGDAGGTNFFEITQPLNSGDAHDIAVAPGDSLGICVRYFRDGSSGSGLTFPTDCEITTNEQSLYANVHLAALIGDVDCNGATNAIDAALVLQYSAGLIIDLPSCARPHVNDDGVVNAVDAALILQRVAGLIPTYS